MGLFMCGSEADCAGSSGHCCGRGRVPSAPWAKLSPHRSSCHVRSRLGSCFGRVFDLQQRVQRAGNAASAALAGRPVSTQDFQELLTRFGADDAQKAQLTAGFDVNKDGAISQDEFLQGLAKTKGPQAGTDFSQAVMQLMDRGAAGNADGSVAAKEFAALAKAFASAEKRTGMHSS